MKLSMRDLGTTLFGLFGAAVVYAKFYDYSWVMIGSWRGATMVLAAVAVVMFGFSGFDFSNRSILNVAEIYAGVAMGLVALAGMIFTSSFLFYSLAIIMGSIWLVDTARHARHSLIESNVSMHHHVPTH